MYFTQGGFARRAGLTAGAFATLATLFLARYLKSEIAKWSRVAKQANVKQD